MQRRLCTIRRRVVITYLVYNLYGTAEARSRCKHIAAVGIQYQYTLRGRRTTHHCSRQNRSRIRAAVIQQYIAAHTVGAVGTARYRCVIIRCRRLWTCTRRKRRYVYRSLCTVGRIRYLTYRVGKHIRTRIACRWCVGHRTVCIHHNRTVRRLVRDHYAPCIQ